MQYGKNFRANSSQFRATCHFTQPFKPVHINSKVSKCEVIQQQYTFWGVADGCSGVQEPDFENIGLFLQRADSGHRDQLQ